MLTLEILYLFSATFLAIYGLNSLVLTWLHRKYSNKLKDGQPPSSPTEPTHNPAGLPSPFAHPPIVTVQLPIYNERHVAERLLTAVTQLDWPHDRLQIQILDDSTDETRHIIATALAKHRAQSPTIWLEHVRRPNRHGFKAGALQYGLTQARGQFIAIFDADFIPPADFLQRVIPTFSNPQIGCIQTRWGHLNPNTSPLTRAQALGIDGHFIVEQSARHAIKAFLNFNGTAGVWRRCCIAQAGGWQGDTLTEDLDLSYRAQLRGWRIVYRPDVVVPAELPVQIDAFKRQQFRWAKGSIQTALKLLTKLWQSPQPLWLKLLGTLHLTNYGVHPLMLLNLLLTLPMTMSDSIFLMLTPLFTISAVGPPLLYWTAMQRRSLSLGGKLARLGLLIALGTGLSLNNTKAVWEAIFGINSAFKRTPKFALTHQFTHWQTSTYALPRNPAAWLEAGLALYALGLLGWVIVTGIWWLIPWLLLYAAGYIYVSGLAFVQAWQTRAAQAKIRPGLEWQ